MSKMKLEAVAWRYRYIRPSGTKGEWRLVYEEDECNPAENYEREPLTPLAPAQARIRELEEERETLRLSLREGEEIVGELKGRLARLLGVLRAVAHEPPTGHPYATAEETLDEKVELASRALASLSPAAEAHACVVEAALHLENLEDVADTLAEAGEVGPRLRDLETEIEEAHHELRLASSALRAALDALLPEDRQWAEGEEE